MDALFSQIEKWQGNTAWGDILDAGTGEHSLRWLRGLQANSITGITGDTSTAMSLEKQFSHNPLVSTEQKTEISSIPIGIIADNWLNQLLLQGKTFDTVVADYLLGAIDGFAPYFQEELFARLYRHCRGRLYIIGQEPFPTPKTYAEKLLYTLSELRDSCILLAGHRCYREYPLLWVEKNLQKHGYTIQQRTSFPIFFKQRYVLGQIQVCQSKLRYFRDKNLAKAMSIHIEDLKREIIAHIDQHGPIEYASDYVIWAEKAPSP